MTIIKSKLFANVEFNVNYNGYNVQLINDTNVFKAGTAYSVAELVGSGSRLANILQWEGDKLSGLWTEEQKHNAFINDMRYSEKGFYHSYKRFEDLQGIANLVKVKFVYQVDGEEFYFYGYGLNTVQAEKMFNVFVAMKGYDLEFVGGGKHKFLVQDIEQEPETFYNEYLNKNVFYLPDHGCESTPFEGLHYYKWIDENNITDHHTIDTRKQYLDFLGYDNKTHRLLEDDLTILKHCLGYHFDRNARTV